MDSVERLAWQRPVAMVKYPHMLWQDAMVWTATLQAGTVPAERVAYDVKVGTPIATGPEATDAERAIAEGTGCKRVDVVIETAEEIWVCELKPYGNHAALGQVLMYRDLFLERYESPKPVVGVIICSEADVDLAGIAERMHLQVIVTPLELAVPAETEEGEESGPGTTSPQA